MIGRFPKSVRELVSLTAVRVVVSRRALLGLHRHRNRRADGFRGRLGVHKSIKLIEQPTQTGCNVVQQIALLFRHDRFTFPENRFCKRALLKASGA